MGSTEDEGPRTYKDLATALKELSIDPNQNLEEEVVYVHDNVRVYFISPNGEVLSTLQPGFLKISLVKGSQPNTPRAVLQVGTWVYPLVPGVSSVVVGEKGNKAANVTCPNGGPVRDSPYADDRRRGCRQWYYLRGRRGRRGSSRGGGPPRESPSEGEVKDGAQSGGEGGGQGGQVHSGAPRRYRYNGAGAEAMEEIQIRMAMIPVGEATVCLGHYLAPHIQRGGTKLLVNGFNIPEQQASDKMNGVLTVAAGAVEGFAAIYRGLETSAGVLGNSLKENTVKIVEHKYGYPASTLTSDTLSTVGNVYNISRNAHVMNPKSLMKRTGAGLVHGYSSTSRAYGTLENENASTSGKNPHEKMDTDIESNELNEGENKIKKG